jgi:hypothetical protein
LKKPTIDIESGVPRGGGFGTSGARTARLPRAHFRKIAKLFLTRAGDVGQLDRLELEFGFSSCLGAGLRANRAARHPEFDVSANGLITVISSGGSISKSVMHHGMDGFIDSFWKQRLIIYLLRKKRDMETLTPQRFQNDDRRRKP